MTLKKVVGKLHLWLGLASGLIVFIIAITGCIYAFQAEISDLTQPYRFVEKSDKPQLTPSQFKAIADSVLPGKHPHSINYDTREGRAAAIIFYSPDPEYYYSVYVNQYTGEVLKVKDMLHGDFFRFILDGHFYLWLPDAIGQSVVAWSTVVFVVMMISGIFLWWPRNRAARKQRFKVKFNASWKRVNYDIHNVLGFYMSWVAIVLAVTGLVWGFQWFAKTLYAVTGGEKTYEFYEPHSTDKNIATYTPTAAVDVIYEKMKAEYPAAEMFEVHYPETDSSSLGVAINPDVDTYWKSDYRYFDQYTLKEIEVTHIYGKFKDANAADKLARMNYDLHTGAVWGLPGKILMFCASLIAASLPVTGFLLWRGRHRAKKKPVGKPTSPKNVLDLQQA
ncbi:PepSY-associated TM helix domain-containing protein [Pseudobacter ginsenosidimutans]|uniref:Putative iron-regulated membrane protein n=1 Tax=Pseudobacter ginsenosidimutans TaxID=661488 RepID=A0A4Q7MRF4_9BACT|nr:PepSY-associated TM helix domain-containing protein [Pseudobacter ginsenosidimutans]QEC41856.1 PepSY domain-containing protein [Pseudobacter ginsenosidimutans]RZS71326.1 putative iron-regulated membrane protein [Pseudobacter ginsenosidimutans]